MHWLYSAVASLVPAAVGLICGGAIGLKCVRWYRISSFEGKSGYAVIGLALLGALAGFVTGLVYTAVRNSDGAAGYWSNAGLAVLWLLGLAAVAVVLCRFRADVPPRLEGAELRLEIEIKLPMGLTAAAEKECMLRLHSVTGRKARLVRNGQWFAERARMERDHRVVVPGAVPLFTERGKRMVTVQWNGEDLIGYQVPLPARPSRSFLTWSEWEPRPLPPQPEWPESKPCYRFRVQPIAS